ncbi:MAG: alpha/beta fold hydrolase, partial [Polyangiales bacterium]
MEHQQDNTSQDPNKSTNVRAFYRKAPTWVRAPFTAGSVIAPETTASVAARLFFTTRRTAPRTGENEVLADARTFDIDGVRAWSWGQGPTILLVHGWNGRATQLGNFVGPLVERGYRVVAFDAPAHGDSSGTRTSIPEIAEAIRLVVERLGGIEGVIAHSMGGAATTVAMARGLEVERAVFISPPSNPEIFIEFFAHALGVSADVQERVVAKVESRVGRIRELRADRIAPTMRAPLLVVHDETDRHVPVQCGRDIAAAWPGAQFVSTEGLGHQRI